MTTAGLDPHIAPQLDRSALVVIDTQNDFADGGASPVAGTSQVVPAIARLLDAYRAARRPIVHVVRLYDGDDVDLPRRALIAAGAPIVRPGTPGSQVVAALRPPGAPDLDPALLLSGGVQTLAAGEVAIWKPRWSAFHRTPLDAHLATLDITTLVFAGCNYPNCPRASIYDASERDHRVAIAADAISGIEPHHLDEARSIGAVPLTTEGIVGSITAELRRSRCHGRDLEGHRRWCGTPIA